MNSQNRRYFHTFQQYTFRNYSIQIFKNFPLASNLYVKLDPPPQILPYSDPPLIFNGMKHLKQGYDMSMTFDPNTNGTEFI